MTYNEIKREAKEIGMKEGRKEGFNEAIKDMVIRLYKEKNKSIDEIVDLINIPKEEIDKILNN